MIPRSHPRYESLMLRERLSGGVKQGYASPIGLIAHGRGEAFDYLLGEKTSRYARRACEAAAARLRGGDAVLSANGNVAALCAEEYVALSKATGAPIEINLFYRTPERMRLMAKRFRSAGAEVLGLREDATIGVASERRKVDSRGIYSRGTVLVPLEDGDRAEALKRMGKFVIVIDLNPLSRTARAADITIVDNVVRAVPLIAEMAKRAPRRRAFDNAANLRGSMALMARNLTKGF